jgi:CDP-glucose 4,6-dehydratase
MVETMTQEKMHFLITGHTGFKGAWLSLLLTSRGHKVSGIALDPAPGSLFIEAGISSLLEWDLRFDIRDFSQMQNSFSMIQPDVVIHMAAQPLVRYSYRNPKETFETNVMGTMNVLSAMEGVGSIKACVVVTTDKVYRNVEKDVGYTESDPLGGKDPYSASKAMADILTQSWVSSFSGAPTAIARAGNVIGGGDVCEDRLIPDVVRSLLDRKELLIRYPNAVRPWQHVLDCLNGYLALVDALLQGKGDGEWNFGPGVESFVSVSEVVKRAQDFAPDLHLNVSVVKGDLHESELLALDSTKSNQILGWENKLRYPRSLEWTISWEASKQAGGQPLDLCMDQIRMFEKE